MKEIEKCKVMLIWNKSDELKNGNIGTFLWMDGEKLRLRFEGVGTVTLGRETWIKRNCLGQTIGSITQYPLLLAYAVTCHKTQGPTLPAAVVHCLRKFVPDLLYVAISRVKDAITCRS